MRIGILTAGGDAPGMNAMVNMLAEILTPQNELIFFQNSYQGLVHGDQFLGFFDPLNRYQAGSVLGSLRYPAFTNPMEQEKAVATLKRFGIDKLIVVGGDGTFVGANALRDQGVDVTFIPATIDHDLPYQTETLGYASALEEIVNDGKKLEQTFHASRGICFVEVMGRDCDDLLIGAAQALNVDMVLPDLTIFPTWEVIAHDLHLAQQQKGFAIALVREKYWSDDEKRTLVNNIANRLEQPIRWNVLGHLQRGATPAARDLIIACQVAHYIKEHLNVRDLNITISGDQIGHCISHCENLTKKRENRHWIQTLNQFWRDQREEKQHE